MLWWLCVVVCTSMYNSRKLGAIRFHQDRDPTQWWLRCHCPKRHSLWITDRRQYASRMAKAAGKAMVRDIYRFTSMRLVGTFDTKFLLGSCRNKLK
jgi:hypothetical protein